uniref:Fibrinogen C-terminal domain-containing protein n=1 Tax=Anopheles farauti TaxID=69004 RepID=A0A182QMH7_9DIPT
MRSVSVVTLLAFSGLILTVPFGATATDVSGFVSEVKLCGLEAFESRLERLNEKLDLFLLNSSHSISQLSAQIKEVAAASTSKLEAQLREAQQNQSDQLGLIDRKTNLLEQTSANNFSSLRNAFTQHASRINASLGHLLDSDKKISTHLELLAGEQPGRPGVYKFNDSLNFNRSWSEYEHGFGDVKGEHWLGLKKLHRILSSERHELLLHSELVSIKRYTIQGYANDDPAVFIQHRIISLHFLHRLRNK